jgi:hypothetical protein
MKICPLPFIGKERKKYVDDMRKSNYEQEAKFIVFIIGLRALN